MDNIINLDILPKESEKIISELSGGNIVVARSKNDFLYILDSGNEFQLFTHTPGSPGGGRKRFPKDEKHAAIIRNIVKMCDSLYKVDYKKDMDIYGVMSSAEEGILSMFPGDDRDKDEDIEFVIPEMNK